MTILGLQQVCTDQVCPNLLAGGYNMRERGETGEHATKVTDVWRKRVVASWGQYGEKFDGTNSDLTSVREKRTKNAQRKSWFLGGRLSWRQLPSLMDPRRPFPYRSTVAECPSGRTNWSTVRQRAPLRACWWSRGILNGGVPEVLFSPWSLGRISL